ncbi:cyclin-O [Genypterus blacodes]|uniref:cyclin-O n=1 Tax=Genypterus blacodes TaxID=154954 RepID=UPI003F761052
MVSSLTCDCSSDAAYKRRRMDRASEALTPVQQRQTARHRKQKIMSRMSDSGFEEDIGPSSLSPMVQAAVSPLRPDEPETPAGQLSSWYLQYGDVGYQIQREREAQLYPCKSLARQPQLNAEARCKLVSWLIPVHKHLRLSFECSCLAVHIMDRFLASTPVAADCFQLLGVTALLLASKQVEVCSPQISHLLSLCCDAFTKEQLCNLESLILIRLQFRLAAPTLAFYLDYYTNCIETSQLACTSSHTMRPRQCSNLAQKVCELSLADYAFNKYPPSLTAHCALRLASELLKTEQGLTDHIEHNTPQLLLLQSDQRNSWTDEHPEVSEAAEDQAFSLGQESFTHSLAQECTENLKLLVSLNLETLQIKTTE